MIRRSEYGQDIYVHEKLGDFGYFVDVGAHDGIDGSNTYALEQAGWTGICIEPSPVHESSLKENRKCIVDTSLIYSKKTTKNFFVQDDCDHYNQFIQFKQSLGRQRSDVDLVNTHPFLGGGGIAEYLENEYEATMSGRHIELETTTLLDVIEKYNAPKVIDFLDIDIEGSEYEAIKNFPFDEYEIKIICIETRESTKLPVSTLLLENGYILADTLGNDDIFEKIKDKK